MLTPRVAARNRGKPIVSLCQRISRSLSAVDAECPSRMPRTLRAFFRGCARTFLLVVLLFTGARPGAALPPNLSLSQILHTAWTAKQGAPGDIWALAQSPDGFLLLGTGSDPIPTSLAPRRSPITRDRQARTRVASHGVRGDRALHESEPNRGLDIEESR